MRAVFLLAALASVVVATPVLAATLTGTIRDRASGRPIPGATVTVAGTDRHGATDSRGAFALAGVPAGAHAIAVQAPGYLPFVSRPVDFRDDRPIVLRLGLRRGIVSVSARTVAADRPSRLAETATSHTTFTAKDIRMAAGAHDDPLLAISDAAGVKAAGYSGAPAIRGGGPEDNKYFLDGIEIGNPYHFFGLVSVFNANTIDKVDLYEGALPARYGDALSAVIDVTTRRPREDGLHGDFDANLLYGQGFLEGPLWPGAGFTVAGRRSYLDAVALPLIFKLIPSLLPTGTVLPYFYDYQGKVTTALPGGGQLDLLGIGSDDSAKIVLSGGTLGTGIGQISDDTGYQSEGAVWHQLVTQTLSNRLLANYQTPYTNEQVGTFLTDRNFQYQWTLADDAAWQIDSGHTLEFGARYDTINYLAQEILPDFSKLPRPQGAGAGLGLGKKAGSAQASASIPTAAELAALPRRTTDTSGNQKLYGGYLEDAWKVTDRLTLDLGARYDELGSTAQDAVGPRGGVAWRVDPDTTLRLAFGQQYQFPTEDQLLPGIGNPALRAAYSKDYVAGVDHQFNPDLLGKFEAYYRNLYGLVVSDPTTNFSNAEAGRSYGLEATLQLSPWKGWTGQGALTLSRSFRTIPGTGEVPYDYDQPVVLSVSGTAPRLWGWLPSLLLAYESGRPYTPVVGRTQTVQGLWQPVEGNTNSMRYPDGIKWSLRIERPVGLFHLDDDFYVEITQDHEALAVDYGSDYASYASPTYNWGLPPLPYLGYEVRF